ncbi:MAG: class I SAM-dependent methyltransferase [Egibacteraceae bacterium]
MADMTLVDQWRPRLRHLLAPEAALATAALGSAALGSAAPAFERGWPRYPDALVLNALAFHDELRAGLRRAGIGDARRILDAGCGPGLISLILAEIGGGEVVAVDMQQAMIEFARGLPPPVRGSVRFDEADATALPFADASFDAVLLGDVWLPSLLKEARRSPGPAVA